MSGVGFFIVAEGEASVSVDGEEVARIGPGTTSASLRSSRATLAPPP